jgi:urease alpha subunit
MKFLSTRTGRGICALASILFCLTPPITETASSRIVSVAKAFVSTLDDKQRQSMSFAFDEQKITVEEAMRAYTMGSAYASFDEKLKGSIEPGKLADLLVLSDDIFSIDPVKIADTKVWMTIFDGRIIVGPLPGPYAKVRSGLLLR